MSNPIENAKTPFYAAVGATDFAVQSVADVAAKLRERAESTSTEWQARADETRERLQAFPNDFPEQINELRERFTQEELRKVAEAYITVATDLYNSLAERGEEAVERLRKQPLVEENLTRAESAVSDARGLTEEALGTVAQRTREVGERAARLTGRTTGKAADAVEEAADTVGEDAPAKAPAKPAAKAPAKKAPAKKAPAKKTAK